MDYALAGVGSVLAYFALRLLVGRVTSDQVNALVLLLVWVGNTPHFAATNYRLYRSVSTMRQYPFTAFLVPFVVLAGIAASLAWPSRVAPYFIKIYLFWSPYHYSGQTLGLALAYCRRAGVRLASWERIALEGFIYGTFLASTAMVEAETTKLAFFGIQYPTLGLPVAVAQAMQAAMWACAAGLVAAVALRWKRGEASLPAIVFVPAVAQYFWFLPGPALPTYFQLVPFFHGVQYLLVAWFMQLRERLAATGATPTRARLWLETGWWAALNVAIGRFLFFDFARLVGRFSDRDMMFVMPVAIAGVQIHHFFVDGVIWKLRNPRVASPLVGSLEDGTAGAAAVGRAA